MLTMLLACADEPSSLRISVDDSGEASIWEPPDSAADTGGGGNGEDPDLEQRPATACGAPESPSDGDLSTEWCARVTPEEEAEGDTATPPPPCGFVNLVGAVWPAPGSPRDLMYCDGDFDGGLRFVHIDEDGALRSRMLSEMDCWVDPDTGSLLPSASGGYIALWTSIAELDSAAFAVMELDAQGAPLGEPDLIPLDGAAAWRLRVLPVEGGFLLVYTDSDNRLWRQELDPEAHPAGAPEPLFSDVGTFDATLRGGELHVAWCDQEDDRLIVDGTPLEDAMCGFRARPSLASNGVDLVLGWQGDEAGYLSYLVEGEEIWREDLGDEGRMPTVVAEGAGWLTVDASGAVRTWSPDLIPLSSARHPAISAHGGDPVSLRVHSDDEGWTFTWEGQDTAPAAGGHMNTYNYVESSRILRP